MSQIEQDINKYITHGRVGTFLLEPGGTVNNATIHEEDIRKEKRLEYRSKAREFYRGFPVPIVRDIAAVVQATWDTNRLIRELKKYDAITTPVQRNDGNGLGDRAAKDNDRFHLWELADGLQYGFKSERIRKASDHVNKTVYEIRYGKSLGKTLYKIERIRNKVKRMFRR